MLISLTSQTHDFSHFKKLDDLEIPIVLFDKSLSEQKYDQIVFNNEKDAEECAKQLIDSHCKNILAIFGNKRFRNYREKKKKFEKYLSNFSDVNYKSIFCNSAEIVKEN